MWRHLFWQTELSTLLTLMYSVKCRYSLDFVLSLYTRDSDLNSDWNTNEPDEEYFYSHFRISA